MIVTAANSRPEILVATSLYLSCMASVLVNHMRIASRIPRNFTFLMWALENPAASQVATIFQHRPG